MKKLAFTISVFIFLVGNIFAQDLRKKAEEHPLDCAFYLLTKDKNSVDTDNLARMFFEVERYDDAIRVIDFDDNSYSRFLNLTDFSKKLIEKNKSDEANKFLTKAFSVLRDDEDWYTSGYMPLFVSSLVEMNRSAEAFEIIEHQDEDAIKVKLFIALGETYSKLNQKENAIKFLKQAFQIRESAEDHYISFKIVQIYIKFQENDEALAVLKQIESDILQSGKTHNLIQLIPFYLQLGKQEKAESIWQIYGDLTDPYDIFSYSTFLINSGNTERAKPYLSALQNNQEYLNRSGNDLVEISLKLNDVETAVKIAKIMSSADDNYYQQEALMLVADRFTTQGNNDEALKFLDFAYQKARKVGEEHRGEDSIGASPLTRKIIYLRQIRERLFNLKRFDRGLAVVNSLKIRDDHFQEFYAQSLVEFTKRQIKTLPRKTIYKLLDQAQKIFDEDEDYNRMKIGIAVADIYAQMNEKPKAVEKLAEVLAEAEDYRTDDFLLAAGKIFELNKLNTNANLRKVLKKFIADAE